MRSMKPLAPLMMAVLLIADHAAAADAPKCEMPAEIAASAAEPQREPPVAVTELAPQARERGGGAKPCAMGAAEFLGRASQLQLVDRRSSSEAQRVRILGAVQLSKAQMQQHLRALGQSVVLVGNGLDDVSLLAECAKLGTNPGREVRVLRGGVRSLFQLGAPLDGTSASLEALAWISPVELVWALREAQVQTLVVSDGAADDFPALPVPWFSSAHTRVGFAELPEVVRQITADEAAPSVVVLAASPQDAIRAQEALHARGGRKALVLRGGMTQFLAFLNQQQEIAATAKLPRARACSAG